MHDFFGHMHILGFGVHSLQTVEIISSSSTWSVLKLVNLIVFFIDYLHLQLNNRLVNEKKNGEYTLY